MSPTTLSSLDDWDHSKLNCFLFELILVRQGLNRMCHKSKRLKTSKWVHVYWTLTNGYCSIFVSSLVVKKHSAFISTSWYWWSLITSWFSLCPTCDTWLATDQRYFKSFLNFCIYENCSVYTSQFYTLTRAGVRNKAKYRWNGETDKIAFSDPRQLNFLSRKNNFMWHMRRLIRLSLQLFFSSKFESILDVMHFHSSLHSLFCIVIILVTRKNGA